MFSAERGRGAHLNGSLLKASGCTEVGKALVCISFGVSTLRQVACAAAAAAAAAVAAAAVAAADEDGYAVGWPAAAAFAS